MSGGSYDYLCFADEAIFEREETIQRMADRLARLGYADDAARETMETLLEIRQAKVRIQSRQKRLMGIWQAVEWWDSCDTSEEGLHAALKVYRESTPISERSA